MTWQSQDENKDAMQEKKPLKRRIESQFFNLRGENNTFQLRSRVVLLWHAMLQMAIQCLNYFAILQRLGVFKWGESERYLNKNSKFSPAPKLPFLPFKTH